MKKFYRVKPMLNMDLDMEIRYVGKLHCYRLHWILQWNYLQKASI